MKKILLLTLIVLFTITPTRFKKENKHQIIYYNTEHYKYDDEIIIRNNIK